MSVDTDSAAPAPIGRTYGNWRRPQTPGLWGLGTIGTVSIIASLAFTMVVIFVGGFIAGLVWLVLVGLFAGSLLWRDFSGRPYYRSISTWMGWTRADRKGLTTSVTGPLTPSKTVQLPGILGTTRLGEYFDDKHREFSMVSYTTGHHTVPFECRPDGADNVDKPDIDMMVASYGEWLASHAEIQGLVGAEIIIETAPDTGKRTESTITSQAGDNPPEIARVVMEKVAAQYPTRTATIRAWGSVTFDERKRLGSKREKTRDARADAMAVSISAEIPHLTDKLRGTGAGRVSPIDAQGLCEIMRVSYDPHAADALDAVTSGQERQWALDWDQVGPVAEYNGWDVYEHDGCFTITAAMTSPPRSNVTEEVLNRLLRPTPGIMRKRVAIKYWPLPLEKAGDAAEKGHSQAIFAKNAASKVTETHKKAIAAAAQTEREVASGAGLDDFVIVISLTVGSREELKAARDTLRLLTAGSRIRVRLMYGLMAAGMAATLPVGFDPKRHMAKTKNGGRK